MPVTSAVFKKYPNSTMSYLESGSHHGDSIIAALEAGFTNIHSIEVYKPSFDICTKRFAGNDKVHLHFGASNKIMFDVLNEINAQCTIFLDGHFSGDSTGMDGDLVNPIAFELEQIKNYNYKNNHILCDDRRLFGDHYDFLGITEHQIKMKIIEINPKYKFSYEDGFCKDDILVAKVEE